MAVLEDVECFLGEKKISETRFGRLVANDPRLVSDMRRGRVTGPEMTGRIRAFLAGERPPRHAARTRMRSSRNG